MLLLMENVCDVECLVRYSALEACDAERVCEGVDFNINK